MFFWKNNKRIDGFANTVAEELYSHIPPDLATRYFRGVERKNKKKQRKTEQHIAAVVHQMHQFSANNELGIYGKARLQKTFGNRLLELSYDNAVAQQLVETILLREL